MSDQEIQNATRELRETGSDGDRLRLFEDVATLLDVDRGDEYELAATSLAVVRDDTAKFALRALGGQETIDRSGRFLIFATGAIACRRAQDKQLSDSLFDAVGKEFEDISLFKHFLALALDGGKQRELRRGLKLERKFLEEMAPHAGASHLVARFILQLRECGDRAIGDDALDEALDTVDEAIELRPGYAKFFATRAAVYRQLGQFRDARNDFLDAIRLEDRDSVDARERIGDYKRELAVIDVFRTLGSVEHKVVDLEDRSRLTVERLRNAELSVVTAVAFLAAALALVQITLVNAADRSVAESIAIVGAFGVVLFGAVALGSWLLRRPWRELSRGAGTGVIDDGH